MSLILSRIALFLFLILSRIALFLFLILSRIALFLFLILSRREATSRRVRSGLQSKQKGPVDLFE